MAKDQPKEPAADPKVLGPHKGTVISCDDKSVTMSHDDGSPEHTHSVAHTATVTLDGKPAKMSDLLAGDHVVLTGKPATSVVATRVAPTAPAAPVAH